MNDTVPQEPDFKLVELQKLLDKWFFFLFLFVVVLIVGAGLIGHGLNDALTATDKSILVFYGSIIAGAIAVFGYLFTNYANFRKQQIEIEYTIKADKEVHWKRLIAFHAEISENLVGLAENYAPERRQKFIQLILDDTDGDRFSRADTSNPIYEDNRAALYEFSGPIIRAITNYYHLELNLNLAIEALLLPEFKALRPVQKLEWQANTLQLVDHVMRAGAEALEPVAAEISKFEAAHGKSGGNLKPSRTLLFPEYEDEGPITWVRLDSAELKPLLERIEKLKKAQAHPPRRRSQARKIKQ